MVDPKRTITVMDLGGGSTQATFLPQQMVSGIYLISPWEIWMTF